MSQGPHPRFSGTSQRIRMLRILILVFGLCALIPARSQSPKELSGATDAQVHSESLSVAVDNTRTIASLDSALGRVGEDMAAKGALLLRKAHLLQMLGSFDRSLQVLYQALAVESRRGEGLGLAEVLNSIGAIQNTQKNYAKAEEYYERSGAIYQRLGLKRETAKYWNNMGALYEDMGQPRKAISYNEKSMRIWKALGDTIWVGISEMHLGTCHHQLGNLDSARSYLGSSIQYLKGSGNEYQLSLVYILYGDNENSAGRQKEALKYCGLGLSMAEASDARLFEQQACECLSRAYEGLGDDRKALMMYRRSTSLRDTLFGKAQVQEMTRVEMDHEFAQRELADSLLRTKQQAEVRLQQQDEVNKEREARNLALFASLAVLIVAVALWSRLRNTRLSRARIQRERERSERLLLNILPAAVAQELKDNGKALARHYPAATILFSDFKDFTQISQTMSAQALVEELDTCFKAFDRIMDARGIEKIKTIGDAYMCVGGLPGLTNTTPADVVWAGLEMQAFIAQRKTKLTSAGLPSFVMRVGIHTGAVVAGIVGLKKFAFDIWGDAVNTACAMEHSGEEGKVNISAVTYELVKDTPKLTFTHRGMVVAKGKGAIGMYFVSKA